MKKHVVALDTAALVQLMVASIFLLGLVFLVGAVVGFAVHPDGDAGASAPVSAETSSLAVVTAQECIAAEPAPPARLAGPSEPAAEEPGDRGSIENVAAVDLVVREDRARATGVEEDRPAGSGAEYAVQVGVFGVEANVVAFTANLRRRGYDPLVVAMRNRSGQWLQRVHLSVFGRRESAVVAARSFREKEGMDAIVVPYTEGTP